MKLDKKYEEYEGVKMEWIHHHNPDLVIFAEDGKTEKKRLDLQGWTADKLELFLEAEGVEKR